MPLWTKMASLRSQVKFSRAGMIRQSFLQLIFRWCSLLSINIYPKVGETCWALWQVTPFSYPAPTLILPLSWSNGMTGLMVQSEHYGTCLYLSSQVHVFGYGADDDGNWSHYWEKLEDKKFKTGIHPGTHEYSIIQKLAEQQKLKFYKGCWCFSLNINHAKPW